MNSFIDEFLNTDANNSITFNDQQLIAYWNELLNEPSPATIAAQQVLSTHFLQLIEQQTPSDGLDMKTKGWKVTVRKSILKNTLVTATLTSLLYYLGEGQLASVVLPTIIPMFFEIEQIELGKKEEEIWLRLPVKKSKKQLKTAQEWYDSLPINIQKQIHFLDFTEFLNKLYLAGYAEEKGNRYKLFVKDKNKFKITFD